MNFDEIIQNKDYYQVDGIWHNRVDTRRIARLESALIAAKITHHTCEDCWYSCPMSAEGCCDERETGCNCGAEKHNAAIDAALALETNVKPSWPSNEWLRRKIESDPDEPEGCPACGAIAGACSNYPNCPGGQMSYSFSVKGATKAEAIEAANKKFDETEAAQPVHALDMAAAKAATAMFTNLLADDAKCDTVLSVNGSVYVPTEGPRQVSITINAGLDTSRK